MDTASTVANWLWWYFLNIGINKEESTKIKSICTKLIKEAFVIFVEVAFLFLILWIGGGRGEEEEGLGVGGATNERARRIARQWIFMKSWREMECCYCFVKIYFHFYLLFKKNMKASVFRIISLSSSFCLFTDKAYGFSRLLHLNFNLYSKETGKIGFYTFF